MNMIGHNFRLGEIECAIGIEQLKKLDILVQRRQEQARYLSEKLADLNGLQVPKVMKGNTHAYYIFGMTLDTESPEADNTQVVARPDVARDCPRVPEIRRRGRWRERSHRCLYHYPSNTAPPQRGTAHPAPQVFSPPAQRRVRLEQVG